VRKGVRKGVEFVKGGGKDVRGSGVGKGSGKGVWGG